MLTLAIDTSDRHFSLALLENELTIAFSDSRTAKPNQGSDHQRVVERHGKTPVNASVRLFSTLEQLFDDANRKISDINLVCVVTGPGMFTGLRVGVVAAKTLAYVHSIPIVGVNSLEAISFRAAAWSLTSRVSLSVLQSGLANLSEATTEGSPVIRPVFNAQRQQLFCGTYRMDGSSPSRLTELAPNQIVDRGDWIEQLKSKEIITGSGLKPVADELKASPIIKEKEILIAPTEIWECDAKTVGWIGRNRFLSGQRDDFWTMEPFYFRPSYAEE